MNKNEVMREYDAFERRGVSSQSGLKISEAKITKVVSDDEHGSYISYFCFNENETASIVEEQLAFFRSRKQSFEWKIYSTDTPNNIESVLQDKRFEPEDTETFMVLDLENTVIKPFDHSQIVEVSDSQGIRDAITVQEKVWGGQFEWQFNHLMKLKQSSPESVSIYVVYVNDQPVTSAWITFNGASPFAGIWGGSTVIEHRSKGFYSLLLNKRIEEAKARGIKYLTIDASDMSQPIVAKRGFVEIAKTTGYIPPSY